MVIRPALNNLVVSDIRLHGAMEAMEAIEAVEAVGAAAATATDQCLRVYLRMLFSILRQWYALTLALLNLTLNSKLMSLEGCKPHT